LDAASITEFLFYLLYGPYIRVLCDGILYVSFVT